MSNRQDGLPSDRRSVIENLNELVEALDRRVPQLGRAGEDQIRQDSAVLKDRALDRILHLERSVRR